MCVIKIHAFIYFLRPPPWYGTPSTRACQWTCTQTVVHWPLCTICHCWFSFNTLYGKPIFRTMSKCTISTLFHSSVLLDMVFLQTPWSNKIVMVANVCKYNSFHKNKRISEDTLHQRNLNSHKKKNWLSAFKGGTGSKNATFKHKCSARTTWSKWEKELGLSRLSGECYDTCHCFKGIV